MPYTLLVCADCWGEKVNLELAFPQQPTLQELHAHVEAVFDEEMQALKPPNAPPHRFTISRVQVYDDVLLKWADLTGPQQLHEYDQLYCFQPQSPWQVDQQKDLPAPRPPTRPAPTTMLTSARPPAPAPQQQTWASQPQYASQPRTNSAPSYGGALQQPQGAALLARERPNVPDHERISCAFAEIDEGNKGFVTLDELERGFRTRGIDFSANTVQELFAKGDANQDQRLDRHEWQQFALVYPNTVDAVYYRGRDLSTEQALRDSVAALQRDLELGRQKESELRAAADAQAQQNQAIARQLQEQEQQLRDANERRNLLEQQERALIEQEVKLERQKDALRHSMHKFHETAAAFDRDAAGHGSPRRSRRPDLSAQSLGL